MTASPQGEALVPFVFVRVRYLYISKRRIYMSDFAVTPHINVLDPIGFGKTVLMPGDPLRSKFIALGADRLGTSRIVKIAKGLENDGSY